MPFGLQNRGAPATSPAVAHDVVDDEVSRYLAQVIRIPPAKEPGAARVLEPDVLDRVYDALTHRRFCALSRGRARLYRDAILGALAERCRRGEALEFFLDIGPGYHASLRPGVLPLSFQVGLGELLMLTQVAAFMHAVAALYPPGARFRLVVDNLCALRTNDVPTERTGDYCRQLRRLIDEMGLADRIRLLVESEEFGVRDYDALLRDVDEGSSVTLPSQAEIENVARFLGRRCGPAEALERIRLYQRTTAVTERLLGGVIDGVRLTQRATPATLGFRSFPGGDARIQSGELALARNPAGGIVPALLTSRNIDFYECARVACGSLLPSAVSHVVVAARRA